MVHLLEVLEPEEFVGSRWHRWTRGRSSLARHPGAAVPLDSLIGILPMFHRALGGAPATRFAPVADTTSRHRLSRGLSLMMGEEKVAVARCEDGVVLLPPAIDAFADAALNRRLYFWLAGFFVHMPPPARSFDDPLLRDLDFLRRARIATDALLADMPGFGPIWADLSRALRLARPQRKLPDQERAVEAAIERMLGGGGDGGRYWHVIAEEDESPRGLLASRGYCAFLPVLAFGEVSGAALPGGVLAQGDEDASSGRSAAADGKARQARRKQADQTERKDYIALNRFEKLLSLVECLDINRAVEDDDEDGARQALDDAEELSLTAHSRKAATRLKVELTLDAMADLGAGARDADFPEWDYRSKQLTPNRVKIIARPSVVECDPPADETRRANLTQIRRRFETFRPKAEIMRGRVDGHELDMDAVVRRHAEMRSGGRSDERIYVETRRRQRDMSVAILADASLSTDAWLDGRRVLDVEQEALVMLSEALTACGDEHAIFSFTSRRRERVEIGALKEFDEPFGPQIERRIFGLKPGWYTRMGAAVRYGAQRLAKRPHAHRLLIVLTDGKPNDIDHYEGRFGIEDTRHAVMEARRAGVTVFGVTVDVKAQDYFPALFGQGGYAIVQHPSQLPAACLSIYRNLALR